MDSRVSCPDIKYDIVWKPGNIIGSYLWEYLGEFYLKKTTTHEDVALYILYGINIILIVLISITMAKVHVWRI